jgi:phospholipid/cholesterol/gamma-HCH transport system substrate-binding protein
VAKSDIKVGLFVLLGLVVTGWVVFLLGRERRVFESHVRYRTEFEDVRGLNRGAPVRMGGVRIGQVDSVRYAESTDDPKVYVELEIVEHEAGRIRSDTVATISAKGMLGDKMITLRKGTKGDRLAPGALIASEEPSDLFDRVDSIAEKAESAVGDVGTLASELSDERLHRDLRASAHGLSVLLQQLTEGEGYPRRFINDRAEADRISHTVDSLADAARELAATLSEVRSAVRQVRTGPGFAHDLLYGPGPSKELGQVGEAAGELAATLRAAREGDGIARELLLGPRDGERRGDPMGDLAAITRDLRDIVRGVKEGRGTVGALLVDPSVYEDVKRLIGNVERNTVLRALVRYSIKQQEAAAERRDAAARE